MRQYSAYGLSIRSESPVATSRIDLFRVIICPVYPYMACPGCGSTTPMLHGRCTVCGTPAPPESPTLAGGGPTPDKPDISVVDYEFDKTLSAFMNREFRGTEMHVGRALGEPCEVGFRKRREQRDRLDFVDRQHGWS